MLVHHYYSKGLTRGSCHDNSQVGSRRRLADNTCRASSLRITGFDPIRNAAQRKEEKAAELRRRRHRSCRQWQIGKADTGRSQVPSIGNSIVCSSRSRHTRKSLRASRPCRTRGSGWAGGSVLARTSRENGNQSNRDDETTHSAQSGERCGEYARLSYSRLGVDYRDDATVTCTSALHARVQALPEALTRAEKGGWLYASASSALPWKGAVLRQPVRKRRKKSGRRGPARLRQAVSLFGAGLPARLGWLSSLLRGLNLRLRNVQDRPRQIRHPFQRRTSIVLRGWRRFHGIHAANSFLFSFHYSLLMTKERRFVAGITDIAAVTLECKKCMARLTLRPERLADYEPHFCPTCRHDWLSDSTSTNRHPINVLAVLLGVLPAAVVAQEDRTNGVRILFEFAEPVAP